MLETFWRAPVVRHVLPNGLTLLVKPDDSAPVASVQVWVKTGSIHENTLLGAGVSHYLEHLLFKGTEHRAGRDISAMVQAHGGNINAYTTFDRTVYYIDLPSNHAEVAVEVLADMVLHSTLPEDEVERERDVILREIAMGKDDPDQRLGERLFETAFREHPYRHPIIGYKDVFCSVTRDDLMAYYKGRYVPNNLVVVVAGQVEPEAVKAAVEKHFGEAPRGRLAPVTVAEEPPVLAAREDHRYEDVELTRGGLAWVIPGLTHEDSPVLDLLATMIGHGDSCPLWQELREKKRLVHTIDAQSWSPGAAGIFYISYTCEVAKREAAEKAVGKILEDVATRGLSLGQMRKAVRQLVVGEINSRKTVSGQAARLGAAEVVAGDLHFSQAYFTRLARVTLADLKRVARHWLGAGRRVAVSINPPQPDAVIKTAVAARSGGAELNEPVTLPNGARLLLLPDRHLPNVHLRLLFEGGPVFEPKDRRGSTGLLATLLTRDTKKKSAEAVARHIEEVGGAFHSFAGNNSFGLALEVLPSDMGRALTLLEEAVTSPAFKLETLNIERESQIAHLQEEADDVVTWGRKLVRKRFFGDHALGVDAHGDEAGLRATTVADLRALWKRLGVGGNAVLVASGDFSPGVLGPKLKALLGRLPRGRGLGRGVRFEGPAEPWDGVEKQPREQAVVFDAFPGAGLLEPDYIEGEVLDELFSGMSSRLFERVREEKGLAYFVRSARLTAVDSGMFLFFAGTEPGKEAEVRKEFEAEVARVKAGRIKAVELERCRTRLKAGRRMGLQTNSARAMHAGLNVLFHLPREDLATYDARLDAVTVARLKAFAGRRFDSQKRVRLVVRP